MTEAIYHKDSMCLEFEAEIQKVFNNQVVLDRSAFYPKGGGQPSDTGRLVIEEQEYQVMDVQRFGKDVFHTLDRQLHTNTGRVKGFVDRARRLVHSKMHTALHVLNAEVHRRWDGAKVTGAQINSDGTARMDFDLPGIENDTLRKMEPELNEILKQGRAVNVRYLSKEDIARDERLVRTANRDVPSDEQGLVRIVEIEGLDAQACGGTHVRSTDECGVLKIMKVKNKGRNNRRVTVQLNDLALAG